MGEGVASVSSATWDQDVAKGSGLVMVDFWATWCGPCRMIAPVVEKIAKDYEGKIKVFKLNTDENPDIASKHGITGIPTLMFFRDGAKVDQLVGAVPEGTLKSKVDSLL